MMTQHGTKINKIIEKLKLLKEWKQANKNKEQYLEEKGRLGRLFTRSNVKIKYYLARDSGFKIQIQDSRFKIAK